MADINFIANFRAFLELLNEFPWTCVILAWFILALVGASCLRRSSTLEIK